ncbi:OprD family porin [Pseudomonas sp. AN-1]|uniref:OprD family porin n=1 Tax=Pseudomonas sp. AN-1 TaxID=3096605 RepID=UPI0039BF9E3F
MKKKAEFPLLVMACSGLALPTLAVAGGFVEDSTATLTARNYYFSRDFRDVPAAAQSKQEEWAQGFILNVKSGYTPGPVGFGVDAIGLLGIKLDGSADRAGALGTGLMPRQQDGEPADEYSRAGAALKVRLSKTELKVGELQPNLPVLVFSDIRLLPPTFQGASIVSQEFAGLTLQGGQMRSMSQRDEAGDGPMSPWIGRRAVLAVTSDRFNYAGADYAFNQNRTSVGAWYAQLEDVYNQRFFSLKHSEPVGSWTLGANLGYFDSSEDGDELAGAIDNQTFYTMLSAKRGGHTFQVGYQNLSGDHGMVRVFGNVTPLANELPTFDFASTDERSWQARYDYDFAALGIPGLVSTVRYVKGDNVDTGTAEEGKDWERDLDLGYTVQSGPLKNVSVRVRNVTARSNYRASIDENRLIISYNLAIF